MKYQLDQGRVSGRITSAGGAARKIRSIREMLKEINLIRMILLTNLSIVNCVNKHVFFMIKLKGVVQLKTNISGKL